MTIKLIELFVSMTSAELKQMGQKLLPTIGKQGYMALVGGHDDDPRELWQIPEVVSLFKRAVESGFISILEVSTSMTTDGKRDSKMPDVSALGALEIWMASEGLIGESGGEVTPEIYNKFIKELMVCNSRLAEVEVKIVDGQHKLN